MPAAAARWERAKSRAAPDGYTISLTLATGPRIFRNVGYDPRKDFAPLMKAAKSHTKWQQAGVQVQQIIEKGSNPLITDMMGDFIKVGFNPIPVSRPALDGGARSRSKSDRVTAMSGPWPRPRANIQV